MSTTLLPEAPLTLAEPAQPVSGLRETTALWTNLGISLLLPVAAAFVVLPGRPRLRRPVARRRRSPATPRPRVRSGCATSWRCGRASG